MYAQKTKSHKVRVRGRSSSQDEVRLGGVRGKKELGESSWEESAE